MPYSIAEGGHASDSPQREFAGSRLGCPPAETPHWVTVDYVKEEERGWG